MLKIFKYILPLLILFSFGTNAAEVKVTAVGKMKYINEYSEDVKDNAIILAKKAALKKATRKYPKAKLKLIRQMKDEFFNNSTKSMVFFFSIISPPTCFPKLSLVG